jgi:hypothetical protein
VKCETVEGCIPLLLLQEHWTYPPFGAEQDEQGNIFGRGAQDTKGAGIQYLETVRRLKADGIRLRRTIHISYMPGKDGTPCLYTTSSDILGSRMNVISYFDLGNIRAENVAGLCLLWQWKSVLHGT